jgi:ABC-type multidrug transport system fused ATPase/permease subunit
MLFYLLILFVLVARKFSRMSIFSLGNSDGFNEDAETALDDFSNNRKWFRTPFLFKIVKFNMPEWRWILLGTIVSLIFGTVNPFYGLLSAQLYGVFGVADIHEQERLARNYAILGFFVGFCGGISQFLISLCFAKSGEALTMRMRKLAFSAMLRQEMGYFEQESNSTGALVTRLSSDASALKVNINIIIANY